MDPRWLVTMTKPKIGVNTRYLIGTSATDFDKLIRAAFQDEQQQNDIIEAFHWALDEHDSEKSLKEIAAGKTINEFLPIAFIEGDWQFSVLLA